MYNTSTENLLRDAWVEIDVQALQHNIQVIKNLVPQQRIIAVLKADAYGHGMLAVANVLADSGIDCVGVATVPEALSLREGGFDGQIIILGIAPISSYRLLLQNNITPVFSDPEQIKSYDVLASNISCETGQFIYIVDTGMSRIGATLYDARMQESAAREFKNLTAGLNSIKCAGVMSHLACSDDLHSEYTCVQLQRFKNFIELADIKEDSIISIANSSAIINFPDTFFNSVRAGIIIYGLFASQEDLPATVDLKPVMSVHAHITQVKTVPAQAPVSYGCTFTTARESRIATIPIGYADGYLRNFSNNADMLINGRRVPVVGRVCMDQCMIDVSSVDGVSALDEVIIMGTSCGETITAEELAKRAGTINYEICCLFGLRLDKVYTNIPDSLRKYFDCKS